MAFDFNKLMKEIQKSAESIRQSVKETAEKMPESMKDIKIPESVKDLQQKGQTAFEEAVAKTKKALKPEPAEPAHKEQADPVVQELTLSIKDSLRLCYCLIIVDGTVSDEENARFCELGRELDPEFESYQESIIEDGLSMLQRSVEDGDEYYDIIHDCVSDIIQSSAPPVENGVRGKLLLWDLLTVAFSEGEYSSSEKRLLRLIARRAGVDGTVLLEMEHTLRTLLAIEAEENWIKNSDRSYAVVEARINELEDRKNTIMLGVQALMAD